jgi:hypothetical protein
VTVNSFFIQKAPALEEVYKVLGKPNRIDIGQTPAPYGHRNNHIHVYDELGLKINEHLFTGRIQEICCSFETEEPLYRFTPITPFKGSLTFDSQSMPLGGVVNSFLQVSPLPFEAQFGDAYFLKFAEFSIYLISRGDKLRSGRRSKSKKRVEMSISLPHDDWEGRKPAKN